MRKKDSTEANQKHNGWGVLRQPCEDAIHLAASVVSSRPILIDEHKTPVRTLFVLKWVKLSAPYRARTEIVLPALIQHRYSGGNSLTVGRSRKHIDHMEGLTVPLLAKSLN